MDSKLDTPETVAFLKAFHLAWRAFVKDYDERLINGEHTMQASLYRHLLALLPNTGFRVFTEAKVAVEGEPRYIDMLVVHGKLLESTVIAAIELKFSPRSVPAIPDVKKDLVSLSLIANRKDASLKPDLSIVRFQSDTEQEEDFKILPQKKLIFAAVCNSDSNGTKERMSTAKDFWKAYKPEQQRWATEKYQSRLPLHLGVALVKTTKQGPSEAVFFAPVFERMSVD